MIILVTLFILWASYWVATRLRGRIEDGAVSKPAGNVGVSTTSTPTNVTDDVTWGALDDHQLTRLLTQARARSTTDTNNKIEEQW